MSSRAASRPRGPAESAGQTRLCALRAPRQLACTSRLKQAPWYATACLSVSPAAASDGPGDVGPPARRCRGRCRSRTHGSDTAVSSPARRQHMRTPAGRRVSGRMVGRQLGRDRRDTRHARRVPGFVGLKQALWRPRSRCRFPKRPTSTVRASHDGVRTTRGGEPTTLVARDADRRQRRPTSASSIAVHRRAPIVIRHASRSGDWPLSERSDAASWAQRLTGRRRA